jgi:hypothetical protein
MAPPVHNPHGDDEKSLREVVGEIATQLREIHNDLKRNNEVVTHLMNWKTGGDDPEKGMVVRMDRIERSARGVSKVAWAAATGMAGIIGTWVWHQLTSKTPQ